MAHLIRSDGTTVVVEPANGRRIFTLQEVYALLRCDRVQVIVLPTGRPLLIRPADQVDNLLLVDPAEIA